MYPKNKPLCPRVAFYTHDTFGLGHVRRCMHMIRKLAAEHPEAAILLVTGSPALHYLRDLPPHVDLVKVPTIVKTGAVGSIPSHLPLGLPEITEIRSRIIRETVLGFRPDVFVVDNFPLGAQSELLPLLKELRKTSTRAVLGLRDILDSPEVVKEEWSKQGIYDVLERYYDKVLIYGERQIFDPIEAYQIPPSLSGKIHFCGYVTEEGDVSEEAKKIRKDLGIDDYLILATGGGGGDAYPLLSTMIEAAQHIPKGRTLIFTGPMMGQEDRRQLRAQINGRSNIVFQEYVLDLRAYMKAADVVVTMCGYNIAAEIVYHGPKAVVAPRTWRFGEHAKQKKNREEKEQIMRAQVLADYGIMEIIEPEELNPIRLAEKISQTLHSPLQRQPRSQINIKGLQTAVEHIQDLYLKVIPK